MEQGDRIHEVIEKAGGLSDEADDLQVNLASLLEDEMVIYIPFQSDEDNQAGIGLMELKPGYMAELTVDRKTD